MEHLQLTRKEIDKLIVIKKSIQEIVDKLDNEKSLFPNKVHPELLSKNYQAFDNRRNEYERRWLKYKNQLFHILNEPDWNISLTNWINKICAEKEINEHHYLDINALNTYVHNLLVSQYPTITNPTSRMINAILTEQGYEIGIVTIKELYNEEQDENVKAELEKRIKSYEVFSEYKTELIDNALTKKNSISDWVNTNQLTSEKSWEILLEFSFSLEYNDKTKGNRKIDDELDNVFDNLWNKKQNNNCG